MLLCMRSVSFGIPCGCLVVGFEKADIVQVRKNVESPTDWRCSCSRFRKAAVNIVMVKQGNSYQRQVTFALGSTGGFVWIDACRNEYPKTVRKRLIMMKAKDDV